MKHCDDCNVPEGPYCDCPCGQCERAQLSERRLVPTLVPPRVPTMTPPPTIVYAKHDSDAEVISSFVRWARDNDVGIVLAHEHQRCAPLTDEEVKEFIQLYVDSKMRGEVT